MLDPCGNYVVQGLVEALKEEVSFALSSAAKGKVSQLSMQKCSFNAIERCLQEDTSGTSKNCSLAPPYTGHSLRLLRAETAANISPNHNQHSARHTEHLQEKMDRNSLHTVIS